MTAGTLSQVERDEVRELALGDAEKARLHGVDLNPFSTQSARREWALGFARQDVESHRCSRMWWRGHFAREAQQ